MPPKAQASVARRGRPAKTAAPTAPIAAMGPPSIEKRSRPAKTENGTAAVFETPKKRGRPAKAQAEEPIAQIDQAIKRGRRSIAAAEEAVADAPPPTKKRPGRPAKAAAVAEETSVSKKSTGHARKVGAAPATLKRRGRPALDLSRVAGSPRVAKRTSPRSKITARAPAKAALPSRINPKMRSRLRTRAAPVENASKPVVEPIKKARGRPKKVEADVVPAPRKVVGRGRKASAPVPVGPAKKVIARPKTTVPRKRRGYTSFEVADKFAVQVKQFILDLQAEDAANAAAAAGEADDEGENIDIEVELVPEPVETGEEVDVEAAAAGLLQQRTEDEGEYIAAEAMEANDTTGLVDESVGSDDETELPSETAVVAEIAAVQNEMEDDIEMAEGDQAETEPESPASQKSVDLHEEITEVSSIPQVDGSKEVEVFHAHVDTHEHVLGTQAFKPLVSASLGTLFSGF